LLAGVGTDLIEISRIRSTVEKMGEKFLYRVFTSAERAYCNSKKDPFSCYAARFAAKEAVFKSLGTGLSGCRWKDVETIVGPGGRPEVRLCGRAAEIACSKGIVRILISLSHDRERAVAFAAAIHSPGSTAARKD